MSAVDNYLVAWLIVACVCSFVVPFALIGYGAARRLVVRVWSERQARKAERIMAETAAARAHFETIRAMSDPSWSHPRTSLPVERCGLVPLSEAEWVALLAEPYDHERSGL